MEKIESNKNGITDDGAELRARSYEELAAERVAELSDTVGKTDKEILGEHRMEKFGEGIPNRDRIADADEYIAHVEEWSAGFAASRLDDDAILA